jgi:hypothetical protein
MELPTFYKYSAPTALMFLSHLRPVISIQEITSGSICVNLRNLRTI